MNVDVPYGKINVFNLTSILDKKSGQSLSLLNPFGLRKLS
ncbi:hypothetical protein LDG_8961 [Legionella drancourtii LLAP12]|uniref:Uncharacterized protein n=1 Tax=Legionella drancourtii LLAP12 TaxID=658187 RepID=G9EUG7_9GAMM|nr:hypothetical protein LDG_8961 [Legionella drancourtii LLAP12]